ncbi:Putative ketoacyl reductase [Rhodobacteraceae bacterium THAF1]|uniref:SDR family oxidoreductase n=1 Tax=Palleronia sp. THAF1 TaxID=2587842 RepID=UPI000F3E555D|nr:SDR family oxidoreductase [Palleronia sp. THAF1]QFU10178.1 Putative ketoacyl reductase [Palleronia sp. THAF1]VDC16917.1 Putative ketoacyl reductase [Rhodobacteraceae bacterium THAF1]
MTDLNRRTALGITFAALLATTLAPGRLFAQGQGPVVLITGCSSGFGRLTAETMARAGYRVAATMRDRREANSEAALALTQMADDAGLELAVFDMDVRSDDSVAYGHAKAVERFGPVDILISNAGIGIPLPLEASMEATREVMETNFYGGLRVAQAVLPSMRERRTGLMIQVTSALGRYSIPLYGAYCASKHALEAAFTAMAYECHPFGIETTMVQPGGYDTLFKENAAEDVAGYWPDLPEALRKAYADHRDATDNILRNVATPPSQQIADAILRVAQLDPGSRPLHVSEGPGMSDLPPLNERLQAVTESSTRNYIRRPEWVDLAT